VVGEYITGHFALGDKMGHQIIKQPKQYFEDDQLYCVWSSFSDEIIIWDATREELHEYFKERALERFEEAFDGNMKDSDEEIIYKPFGKTWEDVAEEVERLQDDETLA
jgi:hypothetical protein